MVQEIHFVHRIVFDNPAAPAANEARIEKLVGLLEALLQRETKLMAKLEDLQAALATEDEAITKMLAFLAFEAQQLADMQANLSAQIGDNPALKPLIEDVQAQTAKMLAALPAPVSVPPASPPPSGDSTDSTAGADDSAATQDVEAASTQP